MESSDSLEHLKDLVGELPSGRYNEGSETVRLAPLEIVVPLQDLQSEHVLSLTTCCYHEFTKSNMCSSSGFPLCRGEADLLVTAKYGYFRNLLPLVPVVGLFSPFLFLLCLSQISPHSLPILAVVFLIFWNLLVSLSRIISVVYHLSFGPCVQPISSGS